MQEAVGKSSKLQWAQNAGLPRRAAAVSRTQPIEKTFCNQKGYRWRACKTYGALMVPS